MTPSVGRGTSPQPKSHRWVGSVQFDEVQRGRSLNELLEPIELHAPRRTVKCPDSPLDSEGPLSAFVSNTDHRGLAICEHHGVTGRQATNQGDWTHGMPR